MQKLINTLFTFKNSLLVLIIALGIFLRFYRISDTPPSLNWDEVSHGYNAYSILKTGRDEWGNLFPIIFRAYGDYKLPVYIYLTTVSEFFFGLTAFAVRLPSVLAGVGTIVFTYLLTLELFRSEKSKILDHKSFALISTLLVAIEPWSLFLSRGAFEANLALFLFVSGIYFFLRGMRSQSTIYYLLSTVFLGLTVWTYNSYRIFTPLMIFGLVFIFWRDLAALYKKSKATICWSLIIVFVFLFPMLYQLLGSVGQARYGEVKILDQGTIAKIEQARSVGETRALHNKVTYFLKDFGANYISHYSPQFLFSEGGSNYQFSIPEHGLLYQINFIFLLLGIYLIIKLSIINNQSKLLILTWLILAPIPSGLTREAPHVLRAITLLPIPMILSALGFSFVIYNLAFFIPWRKIIVLSYLTIIFVSLGIYLKIYFNDYRQGYSWSWQYGYKELSAFIDQKYSDYDKTIVTKRYGEPHEFLLFYLKVNPDRFLNDQNLNRFYQTNWYWTDSFDKYYFVNDWQINENGKGEYVFNLESKKQITCPLGSQKCLLVTSPGNVPLGWTKVDVINFLDGKPAFEIYENK